MVTFAIVQHGEKVPAVADPGLTTRGERQARAAAAELRRMGVEAIYSSPLRRAVETAEVIASALGTRWSVNGALRERMDWDPSSGLSIDAFLAKWQAATTNRDFLPGVGDSSRAAGHRLEEALRRHALAHAGGCVACVSHGGATVDFLRTALGDDLVRRIRPGVIEHGMPGGAITEVELHEDGWRPKRIGAIDHIPLLDRTGHEAIADGWWASNVESPAEQD